MKPNLLILILFSVFLAACSSLPATEAVVPSSVLELTATPEAEASADGSTTPAPTATTPFLVPSPAPMVQACVTSGEKSPDFIGGVLALERFDWEGPVTAKFTVTVFLMNMEQQKLTIVNPLGRLVQTLGVSPDRRLLLYEYDSGGDDEYRLAVINHEGKVIKDFDDRVLPESWWSYFNWQTKDALRIVILNENKVYPRLYNLVTKKYSPLKTDWIDLYKGSGLDWGFDRRAVAAVYYDGANILYDPTLMRVLYPKNYLKLSLTDVESAMELASIKLPNWGRLPRWSEDGQNLVLIASINQKETVGHDEFYIVSRDGPEFRRLTFLTDEFEKVHISEYAWSPDGKRIAFWLNTTADDPTLEGTQSELAILDIESGEITRLCIEGISTPVRHEIHITHTQPVWSPDGYQIAFAQVDPANVNSYDVLVVDLETGMAFKVASNKEPIGWMTNEP